MNKNYRSLILKKKRDTWRNKKKRNDLEELVYRMQLTFAEVRDILDFKYINTKKQDIR